ncbi:uncharacterized protein LOC143533776 [Bidens hawaiensis]|uniref:uncharacterized protein LOC143533776 n=1 Tax=Bidens hawaiensis TaxID=980011 RepID=UPI0040499285
MDHPQLETSIATTITVDPTFPDIIHHVNRLNKLMLPADQQSVPLADIHTKNPHRQPNNHRCNAHIKAITTDTKWFYVRVSRMRKAHASTKEQPTWLLMRGPRYQQTTKLHVLSQCYHH